MSVVIRYVCQCFNNIIALAGQQCNISKQFQYPTILVFTSLLMCIFRFHTHNFHRRISMIYEPYNVILKKSPKRLYDDLQCVVLRLYEM